MRDLRVTTVVTSVLLSIVSSLLVTRWATQERRSSFNKIDSTVGTIKVRSIQVVDDVGRVRAKLEMRRPYGGEEIPHLVMLDATGTEAIEMLVNQRGDGTLSFSNDFWPQGAIVLGHLQTVDDGTESKSRATEDATGAWGLQFRNRDGRYMGIGFANSGVPFTPRLSTIEQQK